MPATVGFLVIDTTDPGQLAPFWCALLDVQVEESIGDGQFIVLSRTADGLSVGFQQVPEAKAGKNRLHLDLVVDDLTPPRPRSKDWAAGGWSRATRTSSRASSGDAWPTPTATSSTSTSCRPSRSRERGRRRLGLPLDGARLVVSGNVA